MFVRALLLSLAVAGCVRSDSTVCAGGKVCAGDQVCVRATDTVTICADPGQREACAGAGVPDGDACGDNGRCYDGTCLPLTCGDLLIDPVAEQCDDGNNIPGDNCSADCRSDETCGNGVVDPVAEEICDDGNVLGRDGCTGVCTPELPQWRRVVVRSPRPDAAIGMGYLPGRARVVAFADDVNTSERTWQWNGTGWQLVETTITPSSRTYFAAVADPVRDTLVLIGGGAGGTVSLPDLWELGADRWTLASTTLQARSLPAATYDPRRRQVVVFGGRDDTGFISVVLDDLITWDGATATRVAQTPVWPAPRSGAAMVYDPRRDEIVMFGGRDNSDYLGDTWTLKGTTWTRHLASGPSKRDEARMFVDATGVVLYGGYDGVAQNDAWRWDGAQWIPLGPQAPGRRNGHGIAYDEGRGRAVLFGGSTTDGETWEWTGSRWEKIGTRTPVIGEFAAGAFDPLRRQGIVIAQTETLAMRDGSWAFLAPAPTPNRSDAAMVFDIARDRAVLFGGISSTGAPLADTRVFSPGAMNPTWMPAGTTVSPPARAGTAMAYDSDRRVTVLFGGNDTLQPLGDTWELDTDWRPRTPAISPPRRIGAVLGYDPIRKKTVLFGGSDLNDMLSDTWEWDGTTWTKLDPMGRVPTGRIDAELVWNPARRRLTLVSGRTNVVGVLDDVWEWTGQRWIEIKPATSPGARAAHLVLPASDGSGLYAIAGGNANGVLDDQWLLIWGENERTYESCIGPQDRDGDGLRACADPDCWWICTPLCTPTIACAPTAPRCGDGAKAPAETCQVCPADATACPLCGDLTCEASETATSCPGDCP